MLAADQRYCLECGERRPARSEFLGGGPPSVEQPSGEARPPQQPPPGLLPQGSPARPNQWLTVIAGVGVLLLAMGVGVLIGRAGNSGKAAPAQVITVASGGGSTAGGTSGAAEETFTGDWPSGTKGYTVQLQTLPEGTTTAAIDQAKTAATAKGATGVGALKVSEYSSLSGGGFLLYSGVYHKRAEAQKALGALKSKFAGAKVVEVAGAGGSSAGASESEPAGGSAGKTSLPKAAPPSVLKKLSHAKGKNYEEESKNLPNVVETG